MIKRTKVKFKRWNPPVFDEKHNCKPGTRCFDPEYIHEGVFHIWGTEMEEGETGFAMQTVAIVELNDGRVEKVLPHNLKFIRS